MPREQAAGVIVLARHLTRMRAQGAKPDCGQELGSGVRQGGWIAIPVAKILNVWNAVQRAKNGKRHGHNLF